MRRASLRIVESGCRTVWAPPSERPAPSGGEPANQYGNPFLLAGVAGVRHAGTNSASGVSGVGNPDSWSEAPLNGFHDAGDGACEMTIGVGLGLQFFAGLGRQFE